MENNLIRQMEEKNLIQYGTPMERLNEELQKRHIRYRMRMNYLDQHLRWRTKYPWAMTTGGAPAVTRE